MTALELKIRNLKNKLIYLNSNVENCWVNGKRISFDRLGVFYNDSGAFLPPAQNLIDYFDRFLSRMCFFKLTASADKRTGFKDIDILLYKFLYINKDILQKEKAFDK